MLLVKMRKKLAEEQGISLAGAVIFIFLTIVLSMSFLYIPVYNAQSFEVMYDEAQIYWTLKAGHAIALTHLQNRPAVENSFIESHNKELTIENETVAKIPKIRIDRAKKSGSTTFTNAYVYKISVGDNKMDVLNGKNQVRRFQDLIVEKTSYALYAYLSDIETAPNGTIIRFWTPDIIEGLTHSNDVIHMMQSPTFWGTVSTAASEIDDYNAQPIYQGNPETHVGADSINFPVHADDLRDAARQQSNFINPSEYSTIWVALGTTSNPYNSSEDSGDSPVSSMWGKVYDDDGEVSWDFIGQFMTQIGLDEAVFVDADTVLVHGVVKNRLSVGSSGDMYLMDDIYYVDSMSRYGSINQGKPLDGCEDYLGLISEGDILIADIFWPGRTEPTPAPTGYPNRHDIVIDAGIVTLGESFTVHCGDQPGERGDIHMWGALAQKRRGVVHTIDKCPNPQMIYTGYGKDYHYDQRFQYWPPPYYLNTNSGKGGSTTHTLWRNRKIKGDYGF